MPFLSLAMYLPVVEYMKTRTKFSVIFWYSTVCVDPPEGLLIFIFLGCLMIFVSEVVSKIQNFLFFWGRGRWSEPDHFKHQRKKWIGFIRDSLGGNVLGSLC